MQLPLYQVDAFACRVFSGNPAAVCPLDGSALNEMSWRTTATAGHPGDEGFNRRTDVGRLDGPVNRAMT